jgi:hypothetical protein
MRKDVSKYAPLIAYLEAQGTPRVTVAVGDMRTRLGIDLPGSAHTSTWWRDGRQGRGTRFWMRAGWRVAGYTRAGGLVTFERIADPAPVVWLLPSC